MSKRFYRYFRADGSYKTIWREIPRGGLIGCQPNKRTAKKLGVGYGVQLTQPAGGKIDRAAAKHRRSPATRQRAE